jgi:putative addiction module CopG family antidote
MTRLLQALACRRDCSRGNKAVPLAFSVTDCDTGLDRVAKRVSRNISLPRELDRFILDQLRSGRYGSASEVVRAGLRLLQERERHGKVVPEGALVAV